MLALALLLVPPQPTAAAQSPEVVLQHWQAALGALARDDRRDGTFGPTGERLWITRLESQPGLRGNAHWLHHTPELEDPLLVELLDARGAPLPLAVQKTTWAPSHGTVTYAAGAARIVESRWITDDDVYVDWFEVTGPARVRVRVRSPLTEMPGGDPTRFTAVNLAPLANVDLLRGTELRRGTAVSPVWIEGERPLRQNGSRGRDRKRAAHRGEVLGNDFGAALGHEAAWQFVGTGTGRWKLLARYARALPEAAVWHVTLRGAPVGELRCPPTGGWGERPEHFAFAELALGEIPEGLGELALTAAGERGNTNFDGLLLVEASAPQPPPEGEWDSLEPLRGALVLEGGTRFEDGVPFSIVPGLGAQGVAGREVKVAGRGTQLHVLVAACGPNPTLGAGDVEVVARDRVVTLPTPPEGEVVLRPKDCVVLAVTREHVADGPAGEPLPLGTRHERRGHRTFHGVPCELWLAVDGVPTGGLDVPAGTTHVFRVALSFRGPRALGADDPAQQAQRYARWFAEHCPRFTSADPLLANLWTYRCFLLRHNLARPAAGFLPDGPVFYEGRHGSWYPRVITFSSPHIVAESRWLTDPTLWSANLRAHLANQEANGVFPNVRVHERGFRYTHWLGAAGADALKVHPDRALATLLLPGLLRNVEGKLRDFDRDHDGALCPGDHYTTGMEFQPSFWFHSGYDDTKKQTELERPDFTSYVFGSATALAELARWLGNEPDAKRMDAVAATTRAGALQKLWHQHDAFFYSIREDDDSPARCKEVIGFYPFRFGLPPDEPAYTRALAALIDPEQFWTPFPLATCSKQVPVYSAQVQKWPGPGGLVTACMWNGPCWPHANSQIADVIATAVRRYHGHPLTAAHLNDFLRKFARFHFEGGDPGKPLLREYGDGDTGVNWGCADYLHSTWIDLVVRHAAGLVPRYDDVLELRPIPGFGDFELAGVPYHGHRVDVAVRGDRLVVRVDGAAAGAGSVREGLFLGGLAR